MNSLSLALITTYAPNTFPTMELYWGCIWLFVGNRKMQVYIAIPFLCRPLKNTLISTDSCRTGILVITAVLDLDCPLSRMITITCVMTLISNE